MMIADRTGQNSVALGRLYLTISVRPQDWLFSARYGLDMRPGKPIYCVYLPSIAADSAADGIPVCPLFPSI